MGKLFLLFAIMPIIEIAVLIEVGEQIGGWNTVGLVILSAIVGAYLVRQQGMMTALQARQKMQLGQLPGQEMVEGLMLVVAGVLLVTPGFVTDIFGLALTLPMIRPTIAKAVLKHMQVHVVNQAQNGGFSAHYHYQRRDQHQNNDVFEGDYEVKSEDKDDDRPRLDR
ncbi:UPF0716 protein YtzA [Saliniradius amylolyticus]|uniref:UPF0716 protein YtzA n=1 Tax=Saliniradius amylolyticus TaxID=2183582 RepID=A0A2S2E6M1_9ALTE|nr:FxsA family protein [Saliniradius amylolyticus]AWL13291.1 UPF0716 protein YtzA [Saliniradius amylolyticus]